MNSSSFYKKTCNKIPSDDESDDESFSEESSSESFSEMSSSEEDDDDDNQTITESDGEDDIDANIPPQSSLQPQWKDAITNQRKFCFTGKEELSIHPVPSQRDGKIWPVDVYSLFITDALIDFLVKETNNYADYLISRPNLTRNSRLKSWVPTNPTEMRKFLGILLYTGLNPLPSMNLYWSKSKLYEREFIASIMDRQIFAFIKSISFC